VTADGWIEITSATQAMGQGIQTSYAQTRRDVFDVRSSASACCRATPTGQRLRQRRLALAVHGGPAVVVAPKRTWSTLRTLAARARGLPPRDIEYQAPAGSSWGNDHGSGFFRAAA
jgi:carbon-monoxide dehydrogenase large subunit